MPWYVYIALLEDGRFYVGMTQVHPEERGHRHQTGWGGTFTKGVKVVRILWWEQQPTGDAARKRERQIKRWSHAKKQALIEGDLARLKSLSRSRRRS
jgi:putative endonuclease